MRAVVMREPGGPEVLEIREVADPVAGRGQVLVDVAAAAINRADLIQCKGLYAAPPGWPADILGLEFAGTIAAVGTGVVGWQVGDRVMGIVGGGSYAERLTIDASELMAVPEGMELSQAAAIPEAFVTAWDAAFVQGGLSMGQTLLVHAAGSGVGTAALQLAKAAGATVIGTSRTQAKLDRCGDFGLDLGIRTEGDDFADAVKSATGGLGADVVLDLVGARYLNQNLQAVRKKGHIIVVGLVSGRLTEVNLGLLLRGRVHLTGTVLRTRSAAEKASLVHAFNHEVVPLFTKGALRPVIDEVMPMADVAAAHERMGSNRNFGKIVLAW